MLSRWARLKEALLDNRAKLGEAQSLQQFSRDVDEMEIWISEKLQMAMDESYKDPSNIQAKHQKHQAFEAELAANSDRIQSVVKMGESKWRYLVTSVLDSSYVEVAASNHVTDKLYKCVGISIMSGFDKLYIPGTCI